MTRYRPALEAAAPTQARGLASRAPIHSLKLSGLQTLTTIPAQVCEENTQAADCTKLRDQLCERKTAGLAISNEKRICSGKIWKRKAVIGKHKNNATVLESGAGDGNRTHVRSLGSFYTAIVRRPLIPLVC